MTKRAEVDKDDEVDDADSTRKMSRAEATDENVIRSHAHANTHTRAHTHGRSHLTEGEKKTGRSLSRTGRLEEQVRQLKKDKELLISTLSTFENRAKEEMGKIRDAWREKLEIEKLASASLRKSVMELEKDREERIRDWALLDGLREQIRSMEGRLSHYEDEKVALVQEIEVLRTGNQSLESELEGWRLTSADFCGDGLVMEASTFQLKLFEEKSKTMTLQKSYEGISSENLKLRKKLKDTMGSLRVLEKDHRKFGSEVKDLEMKNETIHTELQKYKYQNQVLMRHLQMRTSTRSSLPSALNTPIPIINTPTKSAHSNSNGTQKRRKSGEEPGEEADLAEEFSVLSYTDTAEHNVEFQNLREEIQTEREKREDLETQFSNLKTDYAVLETDRDRLAQELKAAEATKSDLITSLQKMHSKLSTYTREEGPGREQTAFEAEKEQLVKERDAATRRLDRLRAEAKMKREVLLYMVEQCLGWRVSVIEDMDDRLKYTIEVGSTFTPADDDPGWLRFQSSMSEMLPFIRSKDARVFIQELMSRQSDVTPTQQSSRPASQGSLPTSTPIQNTGNKDVQPNITMSFIGRYLNKWRKDPRWKEQLQARKPFPTFAAFVTLDEHKAKHSREGWPQPAPLSPVQTILTQHT